MFVNSASFAFDGLRTRGFVKQGYIHTSGNNYLGDTSSGSFDFGEAGLNFFYRPFNKLYLSAQVSSRNVGDHYASEDDLRLDYGLISFNLAASNNYEADFRLGRFKYFYGLFNDIQDIPTAVPGVIPAQAIYFEYFYHELMLDGVQFNQSWRSPDLGSLRFDIMYGKIVDEKDKESDTKDMLLDQYNLQPEDVDASIDSMDGLGGIRIEYLTPDNSFLLSYSHLISDGVQSIRATNAGWPASMLWSYHEVGDQIIDILSVEYVADKWTLTAEYGSRHQFGFKRFYNYVQDGYLEYDFDNRSEAYYVQYRYQLSPKFEPLIRYEAYYFDKDDRDGSSYHNVAAGLKDYYFFSKAYVIGGTYQLTDKFSLKSEFHIFDGAALNYAAGAIGDKNNRIEDGYDRYWNMFLLELTYAF